MLQRVKLLIVAGRVILADPDIMSNVAIAERPASTERLPDQLIGQDDLDVGHNDQPSISKPIDTERQRVIIKLLVAKEQATATDVATLLGIRYQDALAAIRATIAGVKDE